MVGVPEPRIIKTYQWGARQPRAATVWEGRPERILIHHTYGRGPRTGDPMLDAVRYARAIQTFHMDDPDRRWNDSGHNFLIMRSGIILVGRRNSYSAIRAGRMVQSAHCRGQNDQPGIELEHYKETDIPPAQWAACVNLCAWIMSRTGMRPTNIKGHKDYYNTSCPHIYYPQLPRLRREVANRIARFGRLPATRRDVVAMRTANLFGRSD